MEWRRRPELPQVFVRCVYQFSKWCMRETPGLTHVSSTLMIKPPTTEIHCPRSHSVELFLSWPLQHWQALVAVVRASHGQRQFPRVRLKQALRAEARRLKHAQAIVCGCVRLPVVTTVISTLGCIVSDSPMLPCGRMELFALNTLPSHLNLALVPVVSSDVAGCHALQPSYAPRQGRSFARRMQQRSTSLGSDVVVLLRLLSQRQLCGNGFGAERGAPQLLKIFVDGYKSLKKMGKSTSHMLTGRWVAYLINAFFNIMDVPRRAMTTEIDNDDLKSCDQLRSENFFWWWNKNRTDHSWGAGVSASLNSVTS